MPTTAAANCVSKADGYISNRDHFGAEVFVFLLIWCYSKPISQRAFGAKITSYQRRCGVMRRIDVDITLFWHQMPAGLCLAD